jgi:N-acetyl-gamma-glutamyl-phosphate reductase
MKIGVVGAAGYTGRELLRLCAQHPAFDVAVVTAKTSAGVPLSIAAPSLAGAYPDLILEETDVDHLDGLDLVFCALPHGESQHLVPTLKDRVGAIVDLAADYRLKDPRAYDDWYGEAHTSPTLLAEAGYGLPELFRASLIGAQLIAAPGCYPTAAALGLAPIVRAGLVEPTGIIVDAVSGTSGAGGGLSERLHFSHADENFNAYGLLRHRHTPEIEQAVGAQVLFTPHLAPMVRGILATCYARPVPSQSITQSDVLEVLTAAYVDEPFVSVVAEPPSTKALSGSNCAHVWATVDPRTGWILVLSALDNLIKGASGQAVQCANLLCDLPEVSGLPLAGLYP